MLSVSILNSLLYSIIYPILAGTLYIVVCEHIKCCCYEPLQLTFLRRDRGFCGHQLAGVGGYSCCHRRTRSCVHPFNACCT